MPHHLGPHAGRPGACCTGCTHCRGPGPGPVPWPAVSAAQRVACPPFPPSSGRHVPTIRCTPHAVCAFMRTPPAVRPPLPRPLLTSPEHPTKLIPQNPPSSGYILSVCLTPTVFHPPVRRQAQGGCTLELSGASLCTPVHTPSPPAPRPRAHWRSAPFAAISPATPPGPPPLPLPLPHP